MQFISYMKSPQYKIAIQQEIEREKVYSKLSFKTCRSLLLQSITQFIFDGVSNRHYLGVVVNEFLIEFQQKQLQLRAKAMHLEVQISGLQKEGVSRLKQRMKEVSADKAKGNKIKGRL